MRPSKLSQSFVTTLKEMGGDAEYVRTDDLGDHFVQWVEGNEAEGNQAGIWFYVDEINLRIVVERLGKALSSSQ